jgi:hypothetical protein
MRRASSTAAHPPAGVNGAGAPTGARPRQHSTMTVRCRSRPRADNTFGSGCPQCGQAPARRAGTGSLPSRAAARRRSRCSPRNAGPRRREERAGWVGDTERFFDKGVGRRVPGPVRGRSFGRPSVVTVSRPAFRRHQPRRPRPAPVRAGSSGALPQKQRGRSVKRGPPFSHGRTFTARQSCRAVKVDVRRCALRVPLQGALTSWSDGQKNGRPGLPLGPPFAVQPPVSSTPADRSSYLPVQRP